MAEEKIDWGSIEQIVNETTEEMFEEFEKKDALIEVAKELDEDEIPEVEKIYFDMDGVLADFKRGIRELCGIEPPPQPEEVPEEEREAAKKANDEMWELVKEVDHFYDKLEVMPYGRALFEAVYKKYRDKCEILTGIPKANHGITTAAEDKINWVRRLLSKDIKVNIVYTEEKPKYCKNKGCILIDDLQKNIVEWKKMGGSGFMNVDGNDTLFRLQEHGVIDDYESFEWN